MENFSIIRKKIKNPIKSKVEIRFFVLVFEFGNEFELLYHDLEKVCVEVFGDKICYPKDTFEEINE